MLLVVTQDLLPAGLGGVADFASSHQWGGAAFWVRVVRKLCQGCSLPPKASTPRQVEHRPHDEDYEQTQCYGCRQERFPHIVSLWVRTCLQAEATYERIRVSPWPVLTYTLSQSEA